MLLGSLVLCGVAGGATDQAPLSDECVKVRVLVDGGKTDDARDAYLDILESNPHSECATQGLSATTRAKRHEKRLCAEGAQLAKAGKEDQAETAYVGALRQNVESECARKGLEEKVPETVRDKVGNVIDYLPKIPKALGALFLVLLSTAAGVMLLYSLFRARRPSLVVAGLAHEAAEPKVGTALSALIEERLLMVARRAAENGGGAYDLDVVAPDIELLFEEDSLASAVGGMAEVPQLQLAVAVLSFLDVAIGKPRLTVSGELLPEGANGPGVALALRRRRSIVARGTLWESTVADWSPPDPHMAAAAGGVPPASGAGDAPGDGAEPEGARAPASAPAGPASPAAVAEAPAAAPAMVNGDRADRQAGSAQLYYRLARPAAAWVQYEAGTNLDASVGLITTSVDSFALVGSGLELAESGHPLAAGEAFARALRYDSGNVAALVNLALVLARVTHRYRWSIGLLEEAERTLVARHRRQR